MRTGFGSILPYYLPLLLCMSMFQSISTAPSATTTTPHTLPPSIPLRGHPRSQEIPTTPLTTKTASTGILTTCDVKDGMKSDLCSKDIVTFFSKSSKEPYVFHGSASLEEPITVLPGNYSIYFEIGTNPSERLDVIAVKKPENITTYTVTLTAEDGGVKHFGPKYPYETTQLSQATGIVIVEIRINMDDREEAASLQISMFGCFKCEIPTTPWTIKTATTGTPTTCDVEEGMTSDPCTKDFTLYFRKSKEKPYDALGFVSLGEPITLFPGTYSIYVEIQTNPSDKLDIIAVKNTENIKTYTVTLRAEDGGLRSLGPNFPYKLTQLSQATGIVIVEIRVKVDDIEEEASLQIYMFGCFKCGK